MATTLQAIREGIAANLETLNGVQQSAYLLANPTPPAAEVQPGEIEYDLAMGRGLDRWNLTVRVFVGFTSDKGAQIRLDKMLAPSGVDSVKAAIEAEPTLGGACDDLHVKRCTGYRLYNRAGQAAVLGAEWEIEVLASG